MLRNEARHGAIAFPIAMTVMMILHGALATPGLAQVTTTVLGTVQDAQGGALPGATVVLISETRGTRMWLASR